MKENIKILVITVPSWNSMVGANSWATLLAHYPSENLASICIRDEIPDSKVCSRYFTISENRVLKSIFHRNEKTGFEILDCSAAVGTHKDLHVHNKRYVKMKRKRRYSMLLARELVWKFGKWHTAELDAFLDSFKPDIILHSMEGYIHLNRITEYAISHTGAVSIGYIWDDNFTYQQLSDLGYKVYRFFQRRSLKRLAKVTSEFFAISKLTKKEADSFFGIDCHLLTKPLLYEPIVENISERYPLKMLYTGNLAIGRDRSVLRISEALQKINRDQCLIELDVYTQTVLPEEMLSKIQNEHCRIHKPVSQKEALQKQRDADVLLFVEDIDGKDAKVARLSFSTKITDYLSTGKCIFAVGNKETAPMQYFIENGAAIVCGSDHDILRNLQKICSDIHIVNEFAERAVACARRNHDPEHIRKVFDNVILSAVQKKGQSEN